MLLGIDLVVVSSGFPSFKNACGQKFKLKILVLDGERYSANAKDNGCQYFDIIINNNSLIGSYKSRANGLLQSKSQYIYLFDDNVEFVHAGQLMPDPGQIVAPIIEVYGEPVSLIEHWYKQNAFNQALFVNKYKFAPTIGWLINEKDKMAIISYFNDAPLSGGDYSTSQNFTIVLDADFKIRTPIRSSAQIYLKLRRQSLGQALIAANAHPYFWRLQIIARIIKNFAIGNGDKVESLSLAQNLIMKYQAGFAKAYYLLLAIGLSKSRIESELCSVNKQEVSNDKG